MTWDLTSLWSTEPMKFLYNQCTNVTGFSFQIFRLTSPDESSLLYTKKLHFGQPAWAKKVIQTLAPLWIHDCRQIYICENPLEHLKPCPKMGCTFVCVFFDLFLRFDFVCMTTFWYSAFLSLRLLRLLRLETFNFFCSILKILDIQKTTSLGKAKAWYSGNTIKSNIHHPVKNSVCRISN